MPGMIDRMRILLARRAWGVLSAFSVLFGIASWHESHTVWLGWLSQLHPAIAGVLIGAGGLLFSLFAAARWGALFRRAWLFVAGVQVRFAVVEANSTDTPPPEWHTARLRPGRVRTLEFDGWDARGYLTVITPIDCVLRFRNPWHNTTTLDGNTYRSETEFGGWPRTVDVSIYLDTAGAASRKEAQERIKRQLSALTAAE